VRITRIAFALGIAACGVTTSYVKMTSENGAVRYDRDGDGFAGPWVCPADVKGCDATALNAQPIADLDCDDGNAARHPGAVDIPGDGIDQNCDGVDGVAPPEARDLKLPNQEVPKKTLAE
jgi:hypothetical protein